MDKCIPIKYSTRGDPNSLFELLLDDQRDGCWLINIPYKLTRTAFGDIARQYNGNLLPKALRTKLENCKDLEGRVQVISKDLWKYPIFMNGTLFHASIFVYVRLPDPLLLNPIKPPAPVLNVDGFGKYWYDIYYLVCGRLKGIDIEQWFKNTTSCTRIGKNIASCLIKVAATRIFNEPEQSIIEVVVNSIDSYAVLQGHPKVGRFGMGFFSFLYFLIGHPQRTLKIMTTAQEKKRNYTYYLQIKDCGDLMFSLRIIDTQVMTTGTMIQLDAQKDPFTNEEITSFNKFVRYTNMVETVRIYQVNEKPTQTVIPGINQWVPSVMYSIEPSSLFVEDKATGISIDIILHSLLIPSISTKGMQVSAVPIPYRNYSNLDRAIGNPFLAIVVNHIQIVKLGIAGSYNYIISLPASVSLPVTRDDVIIKGPDFADSLDIILYKIINHPQKDFKTFDDALKMYTQFTANNDNRLYVEEWVNQAYKKIEKSYMKIRPEIKEFYDDMPVDFLVCNRIDPYQIDRFLDQSLIRKDARLDIFSNKKVILLNKSSTYKGSDTNGDSMTYLFIKYKTHSATGWQVKFAMSYSKGFLAVPKETLEDNELKAYIVKIQAVYRDQSNLPIFLNIYSNLLNLYINIVYKDDITFRDYFELTDIYNLGTLEVYLNDKEYFTSFLKKLNVVYSNVAGNTKYGLGRKKIWKGRKYTFYNLLGPKSPLMNRILPEYIDASLTFMYQINQLDSLVYLSINSSAIFDIFRGSIAQVTDFASVTELSIYQYALLILAIPMYKVVFDLNRDKIVAQVISIYNKHIAPIQNRNLIQWDVWYILTPITIAVNELKLWFKIVDNGGNIPKFNINPVKSSDSYTTKQLINYVFKHDSVNNLAVVKNESGDLDLQIVEIAINAGTTKPFLQATLTELIQNSLDAIRITKTDQSTVEIHVGQTSRGELICSITDYVGMDYSNIIAISIPFYSNKTASEIVTGEMGTGFFNIYRESTQVQIQTSKNGKEITLDQQPMRDTDTVSNIINDYTERKSSQPNKTTITFITPCKDSNDFIDKYNQINTFVMNTISLMNFKAIYLNSQMIFLEKKLIYSLGDLECYYTEAPVTSYILTKGVPFYPLFDFFRGKDILRDDLLGVISSNVIINIKHGFYTPIQSRTRLNISSENLKKLTEFLFQVTETVLVKRLYEITIKPLKQRLNDDNIFLNWFTDFEYSGQIEQVLSSKPILKLKSIEEYNTYITELVTFSDFIFDFPYITVVNGKITSLLTMDMYIHEIKRAYDLSRVSIEDVIEEKFDIYKRHFARYNNDYDYLNVVTMMYLANEWIRKKDFKGTSRTKGDEKQLPADIETYEYMRKITQTYVDLFVQYGNLYHDQYPKIGYPPKIKVELDLTNEKAIAYYNPSKYTISICTRKTSRSQINDFRTIIQNETKMDECLLKLRFCELFQTYFSATTTPCSVIIHELEHARRKDDHYSSGGVHGPIKFFAFGHPLQEYEFNAGANLIAEQLTSDGFMTNWLSKIMAK